jgi:hypothetical protein
MKAALIPPIPELGTFGNGSFHLLLSHLMHNRRYREHYKDQRKKGAYLVLDNSAHENEIGESATTLLTQAIELRAQEVVVPDCLFDAEGTIESALSSIEYWFEGDRADEMRKLDPALMYVPQGRNREQWIECLKELVRLQIYTARMRKARTDFVIGLSKDYEVWDGGLLRLLRECLGPLKKDAADRNIRIQVHMLGWGRGLWNLLDVRRQCPWVRSTDSAKPFVYAYKGIELSTASFPPEYPGRRKRYFLTKLSTQQREIAASNVKIFRQVAGDNG